MRGRLRKSQAHQEPQQSALEGREVQVEESDEPGQPAQVKWHTPGGIQ